MSYVLPTANDTSLSLQASNIEYEMMLLSENLQMIANDANQIMSEYSNSLTNTATVGATQPDAYAKLAQINAQEKAIQAELKVLETQHSAIQQNMEAVEKLVDENIKKSAVWS